MIDPFKITDLSRDRAGLEEFWLFCLCVAGKKASMVSAMLDVFLSDCGHPGTPFEKVRAMAAEGTLEDNLRRARLGKYALLARGMSASVADGAPDLATATVDELETIPGAGPKTARFFLLHARAGSEVAVIDTHMVKFIRHLGHDVPKGVPTGKHYARLERIVLDHVRGSGMDLAGFDLAVWSHYASGGESPLPMAA